MASQVHLLFVDDSKVDNYYTACLLETTAIPARATFITHPAEAINYLRQAKEQDFPDALLIDVNMPIMNGFELAERYLLEFYLQHPQTRVFMISSTPKMSMLADLADNPIITGFLPKPFTRETFDYQIRPHLFPESMVSM